MRATGSVLVWTPGGTVSGRLVTWSAKSRSRDRGYDVTGVDHSEELLSAARAGAANEGDEVRARLRFYRGNLFDLGAELSARCDVVCCHGVLMYLPSPGAAIDAVVEVARPGELISVLTRNRAGIALRAGMSGDWIAALAGFDARYYGNRLGIDDVRADNAAEVDQALRAAGARPLAWYRVRLFCDHWGVVPVPEDFSELIAAEAQAGARDPYRRLCALTHTLAIRSLTRTPPGKEGR